MKFLFLFIFSSFLSGCMAHDVQIDRAINSGQIYIGASVREVAGIVGRPAPWCRKEKQTENGYMEMWDFATRSCGANLMHSYVLVFRNDSLTEIRTVQSMLDMQF